MCILELIPCSGDWVLQPRFPFFREKWYRWCLGIHIHGAIHSASERQSLRGPVAENCQSMATSQQQQRQSPRSQSSSRNSSFIRNITRSRIPTNRLLDSNRLVLTPEKGGTLLCRVFWTMRAFKFFFSPIMVSCVLAASFWLCSCLGSVAKLSLRLAPRRQPMRARGLPSRRAIRRRDWRERAVPRWRRPSHRDSASIWQCTTTTRTPVLSVFSVVGHLRFVLPRCSLRRASIHSL